MKDIIKIAFHLLNLILILFYIYPGSILGKVLYNDWKQQPKITRDFIVSSEHFYAFLLLSILGILSYLNNKKINFIVKYLFALSIILELFHIIIPGRSFEFSDLFGNILGVIIVFIIYKLCINKRGVLSNLTTLYTLL